jgi:exopolyphosphatase/guanosine-5'-triphosphate,3'-diphosphate pyrophosphatase
MRITRLGAGVDETGKLDPAAVERTLGTLREFRSVMDAKGVGEGDVFASATSAARDASNSEDFLGPAADILGSRPQVLRGEEEGRLSFRGATRELDSSDGPFLLVDVGGGSTELVTEGRGGVTAVSLDVGCVRVTERFLRSDPPARNELADAEAYVTELARAATAGQPGLGEAALMVGVAGTVSALAVLELGLGAYERDKVHHAKLGLAATRSLYADLASTPLAERREWPGMERERADVLVAGGLVLVTVMGVLRHDELLVSESDILDGMVDAMLMS